MMTKDVAIVITIILIAFIFVSLYALVQIIREVNNNKLILNKCKSILNKFEDEILSEYEDDTDDSWIPFPENTPTYRGWYICTIRYGTKHNQTYVMDLFWDDKLNEWHDNRRLDVFHTYSVYNLKGERLYTDYYCKRDDVVAFKPMPDVYRFLRTCIA
jgi:hypothetical protein